MSSHIDDTEFERRLALRARHEEDRLAQEDENRRRMVRVESKLTNVMNHLGVTRTHDAEQRRRDAAVIVNGDVHATSPDVKVASLYEAMLDAGLESADLYVAGVYRGQIVLNKRGAK